MRSLFFGPLLPLLAGAALRAPRAPSHWHRHWHPHRHPHPHWHPHWHPHAHAHRHPHWHPHWDHDCAGPPHHWDAQGLVKHRCHPCNRYRYAQYRGRAPFVRPPYDFHQTRPWVDRSRAWYY